MVRIQGAYEVDISSDAFSGDISAKIGYFSEGSKDRYIKGVRSLLPFGKLHVDCALLSSCKDS
jgi:hypothetical protein